MINIITKQKSSNSNYSLNSGNSNSPKENQRKYIHFHCQRHLSYGQNLYITGNIPQLKNWDEKKALKMYWNQGDHWRLSVPVDKDLEGVIEYKYLEGDQQRNNMQWDIGFNQKLYVHGKESGSFSNLDQPIRCITRRRSGSGSLSYSPQQNQLDDEDFLKSQQKPIPFDSDKYLKVMTFNIWYKIDSTWNKRSKLIIQCLTEENCDFIGVQELKPYQREFIKGNVNNYEYFGESRSEDINDEENGIFYRKDKYFKLDGGHQWFSKENKKPDFGASLPRMVTWGLFQDLQYENRQIAVVNTHFDHISEQSRIESSQIVQNLIMKLQNLCEIVVVLGDFNDREDGKTLQNLFVSKDLKSCRQEYDPVNKKYQYGKQDDIIQKQLITYHNNLGENCKNMGQQVDHIFYATNQNYQVYNFRVLKNIRKNKNGEITYPSDHYPVIAELFKE